MNSKKRISRRELVSNLGAGMAGAALTAAVPAASAQSPRNSTAAPFVDPTTKYPKPPYPGQSQPWPGLASKMDPRPTMARRAIRAPAVLPGRKALITGGDSGMGRAAAIAYAREGADVVINYFPTEEPDAQEVIALIQAEGRKGIAIPGDLRERAVLQRSGRQSRLQRSAASTSSSTTPAASTRWSPSSTSPPKLFDWTMKTNIYAPFWIIKAALPHLQARLRASSAPLPSKRTIPPKTSTTTPRPRPQR